jgi:HEAT repeat protein
VYARGDLFFRRDGDIMIAGPKSDDIRKLSKDAQTIIGRLLSAAKNLKIYPTSHPISKRIITASFTKLREVLESLDYLSLSIAGNVLLLNDKPAHVWNKQTIDSFLTALGMRKIGKITFVKEVDIDEFSSLIELLGTDPEEIEQGGGLTRFMTSRNVHNITVSGLSFGETQEVHDTGIKWNDLLALISGSDEFIHRVEKDPKAFSDALTSSLKTEGGEGEGVGGGEGEGWGGKVKQAVGNIAERLFGMYGESNRDAYTNAISRLILVLSPEMQKNFLFEKPEIPLWDEVVNDVVDNITAQELGDLIAEETKEVTETLIVGEGITPGDGLGPGLGVQTSAGGAGTGADGVGTGAGVGRGGGTGGGQGSGIGTGAGVGRGGGGTGGTGTGGGGGIGGGQGSGTGTGAGVGTGTGGGGGTGGGQGSGTGTGAGVGTGTGGGGGTGGGQGSGTGTGAGVGTGTGGTGGIGGGQGSGTGTGAGVGTGTGGTGGTGGRGKPTGTEKLIQVLGAIQAGGGSRISNINTFLSDFIEKSRRKSELVPAIRNSLQKAGVRESVLDYFSGGTARKEFLEVIEKDLMRTGVDAESLIGIRNLIQKNAGIEDLLKSLIELLNNKNPNIRNNVIQSFVDLTEKLILLGRVDLLKLIIFAFSERLGRETNHEVFINIVLSSSTIAVKLIKEGKNILAEMIDEFLNTYLKILEDEERLTAVITALSRIGDQGDQKALNSLIYSLNRDVAFPLINPVLTSKGSMIFPLLLHSMKTIEDKITRIRVLSLLIDTAKSSPDVEKYVKTYIDDPKWYVRRNIAIILGEMGGDAGFKLISHMVRDEDTRVRLEVMQSLGKMATEDSELLLIEGLKDSDKEVVIMALTALRKVGTEISLFALKELLEKQYFLKKERVQEIQERIIVILSKIGTDQAIEILRTVIFDKSLLGRYKYNDTLRLLCVENLGKMDTKKAKQILTRASWLKNQEVGKRAAEILKRTTLI